MKSPFVCFIVLASLTCEAQSSEMKQGDEDVEAEDLHLILPGTNYCGAGDRGVDDLGKFNGTDACCRAHDACKDIIKAFEKKYRIRNTQPYTMCHCDCDNQFYNCLKEVDTNVSNGVGRVFFNVLRTKCFRVEEHHGCLKERFLGLGKCPEYGVYKQGVKYKPKKY